MTFATFVISTGRCGTQWLASSLESAFSDLIDVEHEPLHNRYEPQKAISRCLSAETFADLPSAVIDHADTIEKRLEGKSYIECGHPCWSTIPYFMHRFPGRIRVIHLTRHPVPTSYSWVTHGAYQPPILPHIPMKTLLSPFFGAVKFTEYQQIWDTLSPFEKCLYYWTEVNSYALDLQARSTIPWLRVRSEDLFEGDDLNGLLKFLDLPFRDSIAARKSEIVDRHRFVSLFSDDWQSVANHPPAIKIAQQLGYDAMEVDQVRLRERYSVQM